MTSIFDIARRYMFAKSSQNVINIINRVTAFVVVLGGAALFIVLAGFAGLKNFTLSFSSTFDPDLKVFPKTGKYLSLTNQDTLKLSQLSSVAHFTKVLEEQVFLTHNQKNHIAYIKGVDAEYPKVNDVDSILVLGNWELSPPSVIVGATIFNNLGLNLLDGSSPLQIVVPKAGKGQVSAIEVKLAPNADEKQVAEQLSQLFQEPVVVKNRAQLNDALYRMLNTENIAVYLIFILVLIIALFNLVGAIIMMILDKKDDLQTLYALGMNEKQMRQIFFWQGTMASVIGALIGIALGVAVVLLQQHFEFVMISPTLAYPVAITPLNVLIVLATIVVLGVLASLVASSRVRVK